MMRNTSRCGIYSRALDWPEDPLSHASGGDCSGYVGEIEGDPNSGYPPAISKVQWEIALGLPPAFSRLLPAGGLEED
jgi:hypothetical protein